jgi:hypothetical protein
MLAIADFSVLLSASPQFLETNGTDFVLYNYFFPLVAVAPLMGQGLLVIEASRTHSDTHHTR